MLKFGGFSRMRRCVLVYIGHDRMMLFRIVIRRGMRLFAMVYGLQQCRFSKFVVLDCVLGQSLGRCGLIVMMA